MQVCCKARASFCLGESFCSASISVPAKYQLSFADLLQMLKSKTAALSHLFCIVFSFRSIRQSSVPQNDETAYFPHPVTVVLSHTVICEQALCLQLKSGHTTYSSELVRQQKHIWLRTTAGFRTRCPLCLSHALP